MVTIPSRTLQGILLMIVAMACFAAMSTTIRWMAGEMHSTQMVFLRNVVSLFMAIGFGAWWHNGLGFLRTDRLRGHMLRATVGFVAMELWFYALTLMPVTLATALSFTTPVFATLLAIVLLGERAGIRRWSAIVISFVGVIIILRPGADSLSVGALVVLASSLMMAFASIHVKNLTRTEPPETIVFYLALFMTPYALPLALPNWQAVSAQGWIGVVLVAFFSTFAHLLMARAYLRADMVTLTPFDFTRLIFTALLAYPLFGETIDLYTMIGAAVIVGSAGYIAKREAKKGKINEKGPIL